MMKALCIDQPGTIGLRDVPFEPRDGECAVRTTLAGICGTDLQLLEGYADFTGIPGHEFVGVVDTTPAAHAAWAGQRVVGEINVGCGVCTWCTRGEKEHCPTRTVVGIRGRSGAFAEFLSLPAANLHAVPDTVSDRAAVFVEPVAAACRILEQLPIDEDVRVAVIGDGRLGLVVAQVLRTATPQVTLFGRHAQKLGIARQLGLAIDHDGPAASFDIVVDATGRREGLARAIDLVRPRGTIVLKSTFHGDAAAELWPAVVHEVTLVGSRCGPFRPAIELLASGQVQVEPLIARTMPLADYASAFAAARRELKVLLQLNASPRP